MNPRCRTALLGLMPALLAGQTPDDHVYRVGNGVKPPRVLHKVEADYSSAGKAERIQGTVAMRIVVDEKGRATDVTVMSPLGWGLDEKAEAALGQWRFQPGTKDGNPVKVLAMVEMSFRFQGIPFDEKTEKRRTEFNEAIRPFNLPNATPARIDNSVKKIQALAAQKFPPAMHAVGLWQINGQHVPKNPEEGLHLVEQAAVKNYGPAIYEIAARRIAGEGYSKDVATGIEELKRASLFNSQQAQFNLGQRYERGVDVPIDTARARRYFRLCAAKGVAECQYRLASLILTQPHRPERDYVEAVAWLQLAAAKGHDEAKAAEARETANLTPSQTEWLGQVKRAIGPPVSSAMFVSP